LPAISGGNAGNRLELGGNKGGKGRKSILHPPQKWGGGEESAYSYQYRIGKGRTVQKVASPIGKRRRWGGGEGRSSPRSKYPSSKGGGEGRGKGKATIFILSLLEEKRRTSVGGRRGGTFCLQLIKKGKRKRGKTFSHARERGFRGRIQKGGRGRRGSFMLLRKEQKKGNRSCFSAGMDVRGQHVERGREKGGFFVHGRRKILCF